MEHSIGLEWRYGVSIQLLVFDESPEAFHTIPVCVFLHLLAHFWGDNVFSIAPVLPSVTTFVSPVLMFYISWHLVGFQISSYVCTICPAFLLDVSNHRHPSFCLAFFWGMFFCILSCNLVWNIFHILSTD